MYTGETEASYSDLYSISSSSAMGFWKQNDPVCNRDSREKKRNKKERKGKRVRRNVDRRDEVGRNCEPTKRVRREMLRERKAGKDQEGKE